MTGSCLAAPYVQGGGSMHPTDPTNSWRFEVSSRWRWRAGAELPRTSRLGTSTLGHRTRRVVVQISHLPGQLLMRDSTGQRDFRSSRLIRPPFTMRSSESVGWLDALSQIRG